MLSDLLSPEALCASPNTTLVNQDQSAHRSYKTLDTICAHNQYDNEFDCYTYLQELCQRYANQFNIKICFQGNTAYATPNSIVLPQFTQCTCEQLYLNAGFLAHETGHICFSDFSLYEQFHQNSPLRINLHNNSSDIFSTTVNPITGENEICLQPIKTFDRHQILLTLINILEDCRVDYIMCQHHPEVFPCLQFLYKNLYYRHLHLMPFLYRYHKLQILFSYLMFVGHDLLMHYQWSDTLRALYARELSTLMDMSTLKQINKNMSKLANCRHTKDILDLSSVLENFLHWPRTFVPDLQRFAIHHQLTSSFDLKNCAYLAQYYGQAFIAPVLNPRPREQQVQSYEHIQKLVADHLQPNAKTSTANNIDSTIKVAAQHSKVSAFTTLPLTEDSNSPWTQILLHARLNPYLFTDKLQKFDFSGLSPELNTDGIDLSLRQYNQLQQHQSWLSYPNTPQTTFWHNDLKRREAILREQYLLENIPTNTLPTLDPHAYCRDAHGAIQPCDYTILWLCAWACYQEQYEALSCQIKKQIKSPRSKLSKYLITEQPLKISCQISPKEIKEIALSSLIGPLAGINGEQLSSILKQCCDSSVIPPNLQQALKGLVRNWRNLPTAKLVIDEQHKQNCTTHLAQSLQATPTYAALIHNIYQWQRRCYEELDTNRRDPLQDFSYNMALQSMSQQSQLIFTHLCAATALATITNSQNNSFTENLHLQQTYSQASAPWHDIINPLAKNSSLKFALNKQTTSSSINAVNAYETPSINTPYASVFPHIYDSFTEKNTIILNTNHINLDSLTKNNTAAVLPNSTTDINANLAKRKAWVQQIKSALNTYQAPLTAMMQSYSTQIKLRNPNILNTIPSSTLTSVSEPSATATHNAATIDNIATSLSLPPLVAPAHSTMHIVVDLSLPLLSPNASTNANDNAKTATQAQIHIPPLATLGNSLALSQALLNRNMSGLCTQISYTCSELNDLDTLNHNALNQHVFDLHNNAYASYCNTDKTDSVLLTLLPLHHDIEAHASDLYQAPHRPCDLHNALWQALRKMLPCTAPRQIMMLLTTQEPSAYIPYPNLSELISDLAIEFYIIGLGLKAHSIWSRLCDHYYALNNEQQIPQLLTMLNSKLWRPISTPPAPSATLAATLISANKTLLPSACRNEQSA